MESGFTKVGDEVFPIRLLHLKGNRQVRARRQRTGSQLAHVRRQRERARKDSLSGRRGQCTPKSDSGDIHRQTVCRGSGQTVAFSAGKGFPPVSARVRAGRQTPWTFGMKPIIRLLREAENNNNAHARCAEAAVRRGGTAALVQMREGVGRTARRGRVTQRPVRRPREHGH